MQARMNLSRRLSGGPGPTAGIKCSGEGTREDDSPKLHSVEEDRYSDRRPLAGQYAVDPSLRGRLSADPV